MLSKREKGILAGLAGVVYMPMDLISDQAALHKLLARGLVHRMENTSVVTLTFKGIDAMKANKNGNATDRRREIANSY